MCGRKALVTKELLNSTAAVAAATDSDVAPLPLSPDAATTEVDYKANVVCVLL